MSLRPALEGALVRLRPPTEDDLAFAQAFANDETLRGYLRFYRPTTEMEELEWIQGLRDEGELVWLIEERAQARAVGFISLQMEHVTRHAELGLGILRGDDRARGLGGDACRVAIKHAFEGLRLQRVFLHVLDDNPAARLYERLGFAREGRLRRHHYKRGAYHDQIVMGLLREEWRP